MTFIEGGVTATPGFTASGVHAGIRKNRTREDLALICADVDCAAAAVYTTNRVKAAPLYVTMEHLHNGQARAILCNSGVANACAPGGTENAKRACRALADALKIGESDIIINATGVIGVPLPIEKIEAAIPALVAGLSSDNAKVARAIMTTDTFEKTAAVRVTIDGKPVTIGGIAKGSGMIHPNMATMLAFLTTDCAITPTLLHEALVESAARTYNRVSVDGDTSTNDMTAILASGTAGNALIDWKNDDYHAFASALDELNRRLARLIAGDGEGATKLITCRVTKARSEESAERLGMSVISSSLVKAAMFGADANWGRVLCAMGYAKAPFRPEYVGVAFSSVAGQIEVCRDGAGLSFDEDLAKKILSEREVTIEVTLNEGEHMVETYGCDLTYDYVKINGDYRT